MKEGRVVYRPVEEIERYRSNAHSIADFILNGEQDMKAFGDSYELQVVFEAGQASEFGVKLRTGDGKNGLEETVLSYETKNRLLRFNRDRSGIGPGGERRAVVPLEEGCLSLRIFVDKSSIEVFAGDGEVVMTGRVYPGTESQGIKLFSEGICRVVSFRKWTIV